LKFEGKKCLNREKKRTFEVTTSKG
jgi:hypothetical protein